MMHQLGNKKHVTDKQTDWTKMKDCTIRCEMRHADVLPHAFVDLLSREKSEITGKEEEILCNQYQDPELKSERKRFLFCTIHHNLSS